VLNEVHYLGTQGEIINPDTGENKAFMNRVLAKYTITGAEEEDTSIIAFYLWAERIPADLDQDSVGRLNATTFL
jgi:hypothetical protein